MLIQLQLLQITNLYVIYVNMDISNTPTQIVKRRATMVYLFKVSNNAKMAIWMIVMAVVINV